MLVNTLKERKESGYMIEEQKIKNLPESSRISLRRAFGKRVEDIGMRDSIAFYSITSEKMTKSEEQNLFFTLTLYCYYEKYSIERKPFAQAVSEYYRRSTESAQRDLESIIDAAYDINGTFFRRLYSLIKKMESVDILIEPKDMFRELQYWDSKAKERKKRIAQNIVQNEEEKAK